VIVVGNTMYLTVGGGITQAQYNYLQPSAHYFDSLLQFTQNEDGQWSRPTVLFGVAEMEYEHKYDAPVPCPDPCYQSDLYHFFLDGYKMGLADAGANTVYTSEGPNFSSAQFLAAFPVSDPVLPNGVPVCTQYAGFCDAGGMQAVTTSIVRHGNHWYVGQLTGVPFHAGLAHIWKISDEGHVSVYLGPENGNGLTTITDMDVDEDGNLYVTGNNLQMTPFAAQSCPQIYKVAPPLHNGGAPTVTTCSGISIEAGVLTGVKLSGGYLYFLENGGAPNSKLSRIRLSDAGC